LHVIGFFFWTMMSTIALLKQFETPIIYPALENNIGQTFIEFARSFYIFPLLYFGPRSLIQTKDDPGFTRIYNFTMSIMTSQVVMVSWLSLISFQNWTQIDKVSSTVVYSFWVLFIPPMLYLQAIELRQIWIDGVALFSSSEEKKIHLSVDEEDNKPIIVRL
ncbi:hypothetical protein PENTCL1PPCAC_1077, partial [Pristionchus entomophagus]